MSGSSSQRLAAIAFAAALLPATSWGATGPGQLKFQLLSQQAQESAGNAVIAVSRIYHADGIVSVAYTTASESAKQDADFTATRGVLVWADGDRTDKFITVPIANDRVGELDETFIVTLQNPVRAKINGPATHRVTLLDDDTGVAFPDDAGLCPLAPGEYELHRWRGRIAADVSNSLNRATNQAFTLPSGCNVERLEVRVDWDQALGDLNLKVTTPLNQVVKARSQTLGDSWESIQLDDPAAGRYYASIDGMTTLEQSFTAVARVTIADPLALPGPGVSVLRRWAGSTTASLNLLGDPTTAMSIEPSIHTYSLTVPSGASDYIDLQVALRWTNAVEFISLSVQDAAGNELGVGDFIDTDYQLVTLRAPRAGNYRLVVTERATKPGTSFELMALVTRPFGDEPTACQAAFVATQTAPGGVTLPPDLGVGAAQTLILSFASNAQRDFAAGVLPRLAFLDPVGAANAYTFRNLPMIALPAGMVTPELIAGLENTFEPLKLISIWDDRALSLHLDQSTAYVNAPAAREEFGVTGRGIGVAVIDSGIDATQGDFANVVFNAKLFGPVAVESPNSDTTSGHGTHVAGTVGGTGVMSGGKHKGMAPEANLIGLGSGDAISVAFALYAWDLVTDPVFRTRHNIRVTNNSYGPVGGGAFNPADPIALAIKQGYDAGIVSVFAAGNDGPDAATLSPYGANPCAIGVANGNLRGLLNSSSSRGLANNNPARVPDITAPGTFITAPRGTTGAVTPPNRDYPQYATISGTSMASPHIAGLAALMLEANPSLRFEQLLAAMKDTATPMLKPDGTPYQEYEAGAGYANARAAIAKARGLAVTRDAADVATLAPGQTATWQGYTGTTAVVVSSGGDFDGEHFPFVLPSVTGGYANLTVRVEYPTAAEWIRLQVKTPAGTLLASNFVDTNYQQVAIANPAAGRYDAIFFEVVTAATPYRVLITATCKVAGCTVEQPPKAQCEDGIDNDGDGLTDFPADAGCSAATDTDETNPPPAACSDGLDNDSDTLIDYPADAGCTSAADTDETNPPPAACSDGLDNDGDTLVDFPADAGCTSAADTDESNQSSASSARVVVADIDTAINPYHEFYYEGSPIYPSGSPPAAVTPAVLAAFGIDAAHQLQLRRTGNFALDFAADAAIWNNIRPGELYWFKGTNIIAASFDATGRKILPDPGVAQDEHGVGTSAAILTANPEAILLFAETGAEAIGDAGAEALGFRHPLVDIVSTSYGYAVPLVGAGLPLPFFTESFASVVTEGKLHFSSAANSPDPFTPESGGAGPWWSIGVAGMEEDTSNGKTTVSGFFPDFVSDFTQRLPYCFECETGYEDYVAGTSFATPRSAGVASRVLLEARRALGHEGGIRVVGGKRVLAARPDGSDPISNWKLRRALEDAAYIDLFASYDPIDAILDLGASPPLDPAPYLTVGWGNLSAKAAKNVVPRTLAQLGFGGTPVVKAPEFCEYQTAMIDRRKIYWNNVGYLFNDYEPPTQDPFLYCGALVF